MLEIRAFSNCQFFFLFHLKLIFPCLLLNQFFLLHILLILLLRFFLLFEETLIFLSDILPYIFCHIVVIFLYKQIIALFTLDQNLSNHLI